MKKVIILLVTTLLLSLSSCSCESPGAKVIRTFEFTDIVGGTFTASYSIPENAKVYIRENRGSYYYKWIVGKGFGSNSHGILEYGVIRVKEINDTRNDSSD